MPRFRTLLLSLCALLAGCASTEAWFVERRYRPELEKADAALSAGDYESAAARYESLLDAYTGNQRREPLLYRKGLAHYRLQSRHEARGAFHDYLREFPQGQFAAGALEHLEKIEALASPERARAEAVAAATKDLEKLNRLLDEHPHDPTVMVALGNVLYDLGRYEEAVRHYYGALKIDAALRERELIRTRMMLNEQGEPTPVTPAMLEAIERERRPLVLFNTHDYKARSRSGWSSGDLRFFNVTGLVRNQSARLLREVVVEARFTDPANRLLDTREWRIGAMAPGEVRPFRVEATSYDNLYNIEDYSLTVRWEE